MPYLMMLLPLLLSFAYGASIVDGLALIQQGKLEEGHAVLEEKFQLETDKAEKGRVAYLLAFAPHSAVKSSPHYYARYALKYKTGLVSAEIAKLKIRIADSFMDFGEFEKARTLYQEVLRGAPENTDYVNYQMGFYYLNQGSFKKAFDTWWKMSKGQSPFAPYAHKALGRYWEKMKFPGNVQELSKTPEFMHGFAASVDERAKQMTRKDLDIFAKNKATSQMLEILIKKHPIFITGNCDFLRWYEVKYSLSNDIVFPYVKKCLDQEKEFLRKGLEVIQFHASTKDEKKYLATLYQKDDRSLEACKLGHEESFSDIVLVSCEEGSPEMIQGIREVLQSKDLKLLSMLDGSRVLRSSVALGVAERKALMAQVSEERMVDEHLDKASAFFELHKDLKFSEESLIKFILYHGRAEDIIKQVSSELQTKKAKALIAYLSSGEVVRESVCAYQGRTLKTLALESKLMSQTLLPEDVACSEGLIDEVPALALLALERVISVAEKVEGHKGALLSQEVTKSSAVRSIPPLDKIKELSPERSSDIASLLRVQNHLVKKTQSTEGVLGEVKKLKKLRRNISERTWSSETVATKSRALFNIHLDSFLKKNEVVLKKLNLLEQFNGLFGQMRFP